MWRVYSYSHKNDYKSYHDDSVYKFNKVLQFTDNKVKIILHFAYCELSAMLELYKKLEMRDCTSLFDSHGRVQYNPPYAHNLSATA